MHIVTFDSERERLIEGVGRTAQRVIENYDRTREAQQIATGLQNAVAAAAVLEVGAVGLGVLITALASTMAIDVTGIIMASLLALLGIFVIPAKRRQAKQDLKNKIAEMRTTLLHALRGQFEREIQRSLENPSRVLRNKLVDEILSMESRGTTLEELLPLIRGDRARAAMAEGDIDYGIIACGQVVGLIDDEPTIKEVVDSIISGAR